MNTKYTRRDGHLTEKRNAMYSVSAEVFLSVSERETATTARRFARGCQAAAARPQMGLTHSVDVRRRWGRQTPGRVRLQRILRDTWTDRNPHPQQRSYIRVYFQNMSKFLNHNHFLGCPYWSGFVAKESQNAFIPIPLGTTIP